MTSRRQWLANHKLKRSPSEKSASELINEYAHEIKGTDLTIVLRLLKHHVGMFITSDVFVKMAQMHFKEKEEVMDVKH
uniref:SWIB domain-containing protein n=1 Tax=Steinernema glaseri TaxID=37863 RepID=A0A1I8APY9_9BILA